MLIGLILNVCWDTAYLLLSSLYWKNKKIEFNIFLYIEPLLQWAALIFGYYLLEKLLKRNVSYELQ